MDAGTGVAECEECGEKRSGEVEELRGRFAPWGLGYAMRTCGLDPPPADMV